ncbi:MAG: hypothetical protein ACLFR0_09140 [Alphaproteobacteria bacterium]
MKYLKYLLALLLLGLVGGFAFFASMEANVQQEEIRITIAPEIYNNDI